MRDLFNHLSRFGIVAGGAVRDYYINTIPRDVDVFVPIVDDELIEHLASAGFDVAQRRGHGRAMLRNGSIELHVSRSKYASPFDLVRSFDTDQSQWWWANGPIALNNKVIAATCNRVATFWLNKDQYGTSIKRAEKMRKRGWHVVVEDEPM
jgi:hypothetical protein